MKYILLLLSIVFVCCSKYTAQQKEICLQFENDLKQHWAIDKNNAYYISTDTFVYYLRMKYKPCFMNQDTTYLISNFGRYQKTSSPHLSKQLRDSLHIIFSMDYKVHTPLTGEESYHKICQFYIDNRGKIKFYDQGEIVKQYPSH